MYSSLSGKLNTFFLLLLTYTHFESYVTEKRKCITHKKIVLKEKAHLIFVYEFERGFCHIVFSYIFENIFRYLLTDIAPDLICEILY